MSVSDSVTLKYYLHSEFSIAEHSKPFSHSLFLYKVILKDKIQRFCFIEMETFVYKMQRMDYIELRFFG